MKLGRSLEEALILSELNYCNVVYACDVLRDLVPFEQFKKHEKHLWRRVTFSKNAGF